MYTNDHYEYLFHNGPLPENCDNVELVSDESEEEKTKQNKKEKEACPAKGGQFYRLKPPPRREGGATTQEKHQNRDEGHIDHDVQKNLKKQLEFIEAMSNPKVKDQDPVEPEAPME